MGLVIGGAVLMFVGFLFCLTLIGAVIGIPFMIVGAIMMGFGLFGRKNQTITNVVQVSGFPGQQPANVAAVGVPESAAFVRPPSPASLSNCGACSTPNDAASKFCRNCGTALAAA
jgi:membrane protease subunit (stomatin/prohibitin family)